MEVDNAFQQAARGLTQRYDLEDSGATLGSLRKKVIHYRSSCRLCSISGEDVRGSSW